MWEHAMVKWVYCGDELYKYLSHCLLSHCNVIGPVRIPLAYGEIASLN